MERTPSEFLPPLLEGEVERRLISESRKAEPREAVGLLTQDGRVIMLPNRASDQETSFEVRRGDLLEVLADEGGLANLTLWHSHPGGGIGPSRIDMQQRLPFLHHLVVTLTNDDVVYTWY